MKQRIIERGLSLGIILCSSLMLCGINECQRDFNFASNTNLKTTGTPTVTPTEGGDTTGTPTRTETPTPLGGIPTTTSTPTVTIDTGAAHINAASSFLKGLQDLSRSQPSPAPNQAVAAAKQEAGNPGNWLGDQKSQDGKDCDAQDSDGDGYADWLEKDFGSDSFVPSSTPKVRMNTSLYNHMIALNSANSDVLRNLDAKIQKLALSNTDNIGPSCQAMVNGGTNSDVVAKNVASNPYINCLTNKLKSAIWFNPTAVDTDHDGVPDELEIALGTDPLNPDTDCDGVLDVKEIMLGSDPTLPEGR